MKNVSYKIVNAREFAEMLLALQKDEEITFASTFETDDDGTVLEQSTSDWHGAKFVNCFDGGCLLIGTWGGGLWDAYDTTTTPILEEIEDTVSNLFKWLNTGTVCIEMDAPSVSANSRKKEERGCNQ